MSKERFEYVYKNYGILFAIYIKDKETENHYSTTFADDMRALVVLMNQQCQTIADLEAKLAESEKQKEFFKEENKINKKDADYYFDEYRLCKKQLAEKDKEIDDLNKEFVCAVHDWKEIVKKKDKQIVELEEHDIVFHNQLAVEQLEKVKEKFNGKRPIDDLASEVGLELGYTATQIQNYIDQLIAEIKGE